MVASVWPPPKCLCSMNTCNCTALGKKFAGDSARRSRTREQTGLMLTLGNGAWLDGFKSRSNIRYYACSMHSSQGLHALRFNISGVDTPDA